MISIVDSAPISKMVGKYFDRLKNTGSVERSVTNRFLIYLFLVGFVDMVYPFFTEEDYRKIDDILAKLFSGCNCVLSYDRDVTLSSHYIGYDMPVDSTIIGRPWHMGDDMQVRITEAPEEEFRFTQDDSLRVFYNDEV